MTSSFESRRRRLGAAALMMGFVTLGAGAPPEAPSLAGKVVILPVSDEEQFMVDEGLTLFLERRIQDAEAGGAAALVLEIDTYGGEVHSALKISDLLLNTTIPKTVAFVKTKAISAGALITLSCQEVVMNPNTAIGDCEPILQTGEGIEYGPEKFKTALRARFRLFAERHNYPAPIGEGMVDKEIVVYRAWEGDQAQFLTDTDLENLKQKKKEPSVLAVVKPKGQLLTLTAQEAVAYGVARSLAKDRSELLKLYGWKADEVVSIEPTWSETLTRLVKSPMISGILLLVGLIAIYIALNHPGLGVPELLAVACFGLLFGGKYLGGLAESWEIALFVLGVVLLLVEFFVIPSFGIAGTAGAVLIVASLFLVFLPTLPGTGGPNIPPEPARGTQVLPPVDWGALLGQTAMTVFGGMFGALLAILAIIKWMGSIPVLNRMVLTTAMTGNAAAEAAAAVGRTDAPLLGKRGRSVTTLRPAGRIDIDGALYEVTTEGEYVDRGQPVIVHRVEGGRIIVRKGT